MSNMSDQWFAHISNKNGSIKWHPLLKHLEGVARKAGEFASVFDAAEWAYLAGLWHDLGKFSLEFQHYIRSANGIDAHLEGKVGRVDHSTAGAIYATEHFNVAGRILAYVIAGHQAGLPDWESDRIGNAALILRLGNRALLNAARAGDIPSDILIHSLPKGRPESGADPALWIRLLFSCVVDADFLDTEAFLEPDKASARGNYQKLPDLLPIFMDYMREKQANAADTKVNHLRNAILSTCIAKAMGPSGIYTLTVPTGGGKTLSSMAFALHHALKHNKRRIIYVIPYTSIIEQTADEFRRVFGEAVIEHHSNLDVADETKDTTKSRLSCENWDAPIIVTTSVQFFESLFASRTSRCRKLHNIVNSIVILDEAQLLPPEFLNPILHVLRELNKNYGVTILLSTATQPALGPQPQFNFVGIPNMVELMENPLELHCRTPYGCVD